MDYMARSEAAVEPYDRKATCVLRQRPPSTGRIKIDSIYYPYRLDVWYKKGDGGGIAVLEITCEPEKLAYQRNPELAYLTAVMIVAKIQKKKS